MQRVLIANRGEIALRLIEAASALGHHTIAINAPADRTSLHTVVADEVVELPGDGVAAYLDIDAVLAAAIQTGATMIHPGYGFLAENAEFARRCGDEGIVFVGPPPEALELFGDKVAARRLATDAGVPVVPGTEDAVSKESAAEAAAAIGFPVMVKASAGGGGRGMRAVTDPSELDAAIDRCAGEAGAAFGDSTLFIERLVERPRHIEVQVLADSHGRVIHLWDRDCSVQQRNQKVLEVAPATGIEPSLRAAMLDDAVRLIAAATTTGRPYCGAATVEFLLDPERGEYYFIECNPRVQVEHTVTEEITGVDIVETMFALAGGARLDGLGLGSETELVAPRGVAVQARVVAVGVGTIGMYQEPTGRGLRVDGCGYPGYTPSPQFDPLLAKVIASGPTLATALDRLSRALPRFHLTGLPVNLGSLAAIAADPEVVAGDARTTLLAEKPELLEQSPLAHRAAELLHAGEPSASSTPSAGVTRPAVEIGPDHVAVASPGACTVTDVAVSVGDAVSAGAVLVVLNAMKMETVVTAPTSGRVAALAEVTVGDTVEAGEVLVGLEPAEVAAGQSPTVDPAETWQPMLDDVATLRDLAEERLGPDSLEPGVVRQRNRNKYDCRRRIDLLLDTGTFEEVGSLAGFASYADDGSIEAFTPANHVGGTGMIDQREVVVCADDFTSRGGHADGAIGEKSRYLDRLSIQLRVPSLRLLDGSSGGGSVATMVPKQKAEGESAAKESSGAISSGKPRVSGGGGSFLPGHLGVRAYTEQLAVVPVVNLLLGSVVGIGAAKAVLGHFSVMVRDIAQLFVAGPPVVSHAMGYDITKEDLGDWRVHCVNGSVDNLAESEEDAFEQARRFLSYLPSSVYETPPVIGSTDRADRREEELFRVIPRKRTTTYDMRRVIELLVDVGSWFEIGGLWGTDQITGLARFDGHPVGVIASDSRHVNGGALTADGCDKLTRFLDLCDVFHLPVVNLCDNPGFAVGLENEQQGTIRKGGEWMVAMTQCASPMFTAVLRRSFGVGGNHFATPHAHPNVRVVWPSADVGGIPPEGGIEAAYKRQLAEAEDPAALRAELEARIEAVRGPIGPLSRFEMEEMIDPRDTRARICAWVPRAYRLLSHADRLGPRPLAFRP